MNHDQRSILQKWLLIGSPLLTATITVALAFAIDHGSLSLLTPYKLLIATLNGALAIVGAGVSGWFHIGTVQSRVSQMVERAVAGFVLHSFFLGAVAVPIGLLFLVAQ